VVRTVFLECPSCGNGAWVDVTDEPDGTTSLKCPRCSEVFRTRVWEPGHR